MKLELERRHLDTSKKTVLYSNDTVSEEDAKKYQELGFTDLSILEGGYNSYVEAKKKLLLFQNIVCTFIHSGYKI